MTKISISVTVITHNEENNIKDCLASVCWADEIIVVDSNSTDKTVEFCKEFTDTIFIRKWEGFAAQKQFAIDQCKHEWVLSIDADERVLPACRDEIIETIKRNDAADGYLIARQSYFLNKWIKYSGWYPGYQLRFFKRSKTHVSQTLVHEGFIVDGRIGTFENDLVHYSHPSLFISLEKLNRYSTLEALDRIDRKKVYWYDFIIHPFGVFVKKYFIQKGFLDGLHGFLLSVITTFLKMVLYMKLWKFQKMSPHEIRKLKKVTC